MTITELAPAKVNLALHITGKRQDGYHDLDSLVVFPNIADKLEFRESSKIRLKRLGTFKKNLPRRSENLVVHTAKTLASVPSNTSSGVDIVLQKNLPIAAGVGGGSSDAAATLNALNKLWQLRLTATELHDFALSLGADVPVCLSNSPARIQGKGEIITRFGNFPSGAIVLVNPNTQLQTAEVFNNLENPNNPPLPQLNPFPSNLAELAQWLKNTRNDLRLPAQQTVPIIHNIINMFNQTDRCLYAGLSGSGPTCFGIFEDFAFADSIRKYVRDIDRDWWVKSGTF